MKAPCLYSVRPFTKDAVRSPLRDGTVERVWWALVRYSIMRHTRLTCG